MRTAWGYDVSASSIDPILSEDEFNSRTGNAYASNPRVGDALKAASQAIRNFCGWHITPSLSCTAKPNGGSVVLRLPAGYVSAISSIEEDGSEIDPANYQWREDGLVKRGCPNVWTDKWGGISVTYAAGYEAEAVPDLQEAVCAITAGILSVAPGVTSESADGVAVSYSASAASIAAALTSQQKSALIPYKVVNNYAV